MSHIESIWSVIIHKLVIKLVSYLYIHIFLCRFDKVTVQNKGFKSNYNYGTLATH